MLDLQLLQRYPGPNLDAGPRRQLVRAHPKALPYLEDLMLNHEALVQVPGTCFLEDGLENRPWETDGFQGSSAVGLGVGCSFPPGVFVSLCSSHGDETFLPKRQWDNDLGTFVSRPPGTPPGPGDET